MARHAYAIMSTGGTSVLAVQWKCDIPGWHHIQDVIGDDKYGYQIAAYPTAERAVEIADRFNKPESEHYRMYDIVRIKLCT